MPNDHASGSVATVEIKLRLFSTTVLASDGEAAASRSLRGDQRVACGAGGFRTEGRLVRLQRE
ncbi:MAG: hypothetical protein OXI87_01970 [Albidovulum sp.]|nr:hypothetical protein [Albidovulum sp.]MDE0533145.1 hypothetical protein [Albidovulum sp.]